MTVKPDFCRHLLAEGVALYTHTHAHTQSLISLCCSLLWMASSFFNFLSISLVVSLSIVTKRGLPLNTRRAAPIKGEIKTKVSVWCFCHIQQRFHFLLIHWASIASHDPHYLLRMDTWMDSGDILGQMWLSRSNKIFFQTFIFLNIPKHMSSWISVFENVFESVFDLLWINSLDPKINFTLGSGVSAEKLELNQPLLLLSSVWPQLK